MTILSVLRRHHDLDLGNGLAPRGGFFPQVLLEPWPRRPRSALHQSFTSLRSGVTSPLELGTHILVMVSALWWLKTQGPWPLVA